MRRPAIRQGIRSGMVGGSAVLYFSAVGMVGAFALRNLVGTEVTLGKVLLWLPPVVAGWAAARPRRGAEGVVPPSTPDALLGGAVAGLSVAVLVGLGVAIVEVLGVDAVRGVLIAVSPDLIGIITIHMATAVGLVSFGVAMTVLSLAGASLRLLPAIARRTIVAGLSAVVIMGLLQRIVPTAMSELGLRTNWLYDPITGGLTRAGAALVLVVTAVLVFGTDRWGGSVRGGIRALRDEGARGETARIVPMVTVVALVLVPAVVLVFLPRLLGSIVNDVLGFVGIYLLLALGLNIIVGNAGLLHLGFVVFFTIGAYATALLTGAERVNPLGRVPPVLPFRLSFYVALPIVMAIAAVVGVLIAAPTVRLRGDYLAIVTLGFGAIASVLVQSDWLKNVLGGPLGLRNVPPAPLFGIEMRSPARFYYLALAASAAATFVSWRLTSSRVGRAWNAMREDEQVAETMGISVVRYKLLASAVGGAIGAVGGALFAVKIGSVTSQSFTILVSITALAVVILGGLGSVRGAVVGALVLVGLPNLLTEFENYRLAIYGAVLIAIMLYRPQGLLPNVRVARELQEEDRAQDQWLRAHDPEAAAAAEAETSAAIAADERAIERPEPA